MKAFVDGVTAAATGAIAGATLVLGQRALLEPVSHAPKWPAVVICAVTAFALWRVKKLPEPLVIGVAGAVGIAVQRL